jgi:uncharacterized membrane protein YoaK (UPF0700 family)
VIFGDSYTFAYSLIHLSLLSFTFGFANVNSLLRFGVFSAMMSGNAILNFLDLEIGDYRDICFNLSIILSFLFGTLLSCFILEKTNDRYVSFGIIYLCVVLTVCLVEINEIISHGNCTRYLMCFVSCAMGGISEWTTKLGYVVMFQTGNLMRLTEMIFKFICGYSQGGNKLRGDGIITVFIIIAYFVGGVFSTFTVFKLSMFPIVFLFPFHLYFSGCLHHYGWFNESFSIYDYICKMKVIDYIVHNSWTSSGNMESPNVIKLLQVFKESNARDLENQSEVESRPSSLASMDASPIHVAQQDSNVRSENISSVSAPTVHRKRTYQRSSQHSFLERFAISEEVRNDYILSQCGYERRTTFV